MKQTKLTIYSLPYQLVCLLNESSRREVWNVGKVVMPSVVSHNIVTSSGFGTLVLQHILEVLHGMCYGSHHFLLAKVKNLHHVSHLAQRIVFLLLCASFDDVSHISKGEGRNKQLQLARETASENLLRIVSTCTVVDVVYQNVGVKKYPFHRAIMCAKCSSCAISSSVILTMPRSFLNDAGTCLIVLGFSFSAIDSVRNITTICFCSRLIPSISPMYGPIGVDFTFNAVAVIILTCLVSACKFRKNY